MNKELLNSWLRDVIIGLNLCPFAKVPYEKNLIHLEESSANTEDGIIEAFLDHLNHVQEKSEREIATSLIYFPELKINFESYFAISETIQDMLVELKIDDLFQVVVFHPEFYFEGLSKDCRANFVNRSPFPLFHLLRKVELDALELTPEDGEKISFDNEKKLMELDDNQFNKLFSFL